jgi:type IV secretory pathway TrbL component
MSVLITIVVVLVVAALILWAIQNLPLDATLVRVIRAIVIVACVLYALAALTGHGPLLPWRG